MLRAFRHGVRFWSTDRQGTTVNVRLGKLGGKERSRRYTIAEEKGRERCRRMGSERIEGASSSRCLSRLRWKRRRWMIPTTWRRKWTTPTG